MITGKRSGLNRKVYSDFFFLGGGFDLIVFFFLICRPLTKRRRESNPGRLGGKRERFLCAMPSPRKCTVIQDKSFSFRLSFISTTCFGFNLTKHLKLKFQDPVVSKSAWPTPTRTALSSCPTTDPWGMTSGKSFLVFCALTAGTASCGSLLVSCSWVLPRPCSSVGRASFKGLSLVQLYWCGFESWTRYRS